ncbi:hypothetical protein A4D02_18970 [Niastella koreensis]|uniref:Kelch repeat type 2-containing protein n=3 Tax=Niastella koreensis TaxID=354356 RepID=G8T7W2_NIAKG|nr:kelch repeat-containing protein [Niastella koreensis]AEV96900.1 Kelch repeat type 2-containing protein [Niastella koreensis GR20-10]OQP39394.1 hypothetical protein A4D02_18970 [Niastella koreensis]
MEGNAQTVTWTWVSGDNTSNVAGVYGTKGTPAATNKPGNRDSHSGWKDASGNFWIFGGWDISSKLYNDLWMYNTSTGNWTWVSGDNSTNNQGVYGTKGTAAATNKPGSRYGQVEWTDASGHFWIFGGYGYDGAGNKGYLNDLWMYNPATGNWTWVSGDNTRNNAGVYGTKGTAAAANKPGGREYPAGWIDGSGNFWVFGGYGDDSGGSVGDENDLWKYNPTTNQWTWVSGDNTRNNAGVYGTKGTPAGTNKPGGRDSQSGWIDASGNFWIFGGWDASNNLYNDLWKYSPTTSQWTWVSGDNTQNNSGVYGTKGTGATTNKPGSRYGQNVLVDASGNFWFFGGNGEDGSGAAGALNDLWEYTPSSGKWTWQSGDNTRNSTGVYGTKGTGVATNKPGGRAYAAGWIDATGNLWIEGGYNANAGDDFNDLMKLNSLTILPIRDISLRGTHRSNDNVLVWETLGELNTGQFIIERSSNGSDYTAVGKVTAVGTGNNHYTFTDNNAIGASFYYRIQVQDLDGLVYYSPTIILAGSAETRVSVYPNPATSGMKLRIGNNSLLNTIARLYDANGQLLETFRINSQEQYIDLHRFTKGFLMLRLDNGQTISIIKE